jgi:hydroxyethylthiazole kinase
MVALAPKVARLNHDEFSALTRSEPTRAAVSAYARDRNIVVGLSGETDLVTDGARAAMIENGHPLMAKVTAMGCAASALVAACLAVEPDGWRATVAGLLIVGVAGELAAAKSQGPGSVAVAILDELHNLDGQTLIAHARTDIEKAT